MNIKGASPFYFLNPKPIPETDWEKTAYQQNRWNALLGFFEQMLQVQKYALALIFVDKCGGYSSLTRSARSSDTMHVVLYLVWQVIIYDMLNVGKVKPFAGHISGNQDILLPFLHSTVRQIDHSGNSWPWSCHCIIQYGLWWETGNSMLKLLPVHSKDWRSPAFMIVKSLQVQLENARSPRLSRKAKILARKANLERADGIFSVLLVKTTMNSHAVNATGDELLQDVVNVSSPLSKHQNLHGHTPFAQWNILYSTIPSISGSPNLFLESLS